MGVDVDRLLSHASAALVGGGLYLTGDDNLRITTIGALAGAVLAIEGRQVSPEGTPVPIAERHVPSSATTPAPRRFPVAEGILTNAAAARNDGQRRCAATSSPSWKSCAGAARRSRSARCCRAISPAARGSPGRAR
jgi:hypothetical protein